MKPTKLFFTICLGVLALILLAFGLLRMKFGAFLPPKIDENVPNAIVIAAIGILLWNRKLRSDADKAEAERKRLEQEKAAAAQDAADAGESEPSSDSKAASGDSGRDAG